MTGKEIKELRTQLGLTQEQLGEDCGVTKSAVSDWENEKRKPSKAALKILEEIKNGSVVSIKLTAEEEDLLAANLEAGFFHSPEAFLHSTLVHLQKYGRFDTPFPFKLADNAPVEAELREKRAQAAYGRARRIRKEEDDVQNIQDPYQEEELENGADGGEAGTA